MAKQATKVGADVNWSFTLSAPRFLILALLTGCGAGSGQVEYKVGDVSTGTGADATTNADTDEDDDLADWSGATLVVESPQSGEVLPYSELSDFSAVVLDASGEPTDFDDLIWTTNASPWTETGASFESDGLDVGTQAITVDATLPDGTVLRNTVGGVRVQHPDTGTYVGNLAVNLAGEFNDFPINAACIGAAIITVDAYGETAVGDSTCVVSLLGFSTEALHVFNFAVDDSSVFGDVALDLSFFQVDFEVEGELGDETLTAEWATDYGGFLAIDGTLDLVRVTTEIAELE